MPHISQSANGLSRLPAAVVCICACAVLALGTAVSPPSGPVTGASWIWHPDAVNTSNCRVYLAATITIPSAPAEAIFWGTADNEYILYVNGRKVGGSPGPGHAGEWWRRLDQCDLTSLLRPGTNVLAVEAYNFTGPAGFVGRLDIRLPDGEIMTLVTDESWYAALDPPKNWPHAPALPFRKHATSLGKPPVLPWGRPASPSSLSEIISGLRTEPVRTFVLPERIIDIQGPPEAVRQPDKMLRADGETARIEAIEEEIAIVLDFGREVVGYFRAKTFGASAELNLAYGESVRECLQAKPFQPIDRRTTDPGHWEWVDSERRAFRYLKINIGGMSGPLDVDYFGLDLVGYPVENKGSFRCSDDLLNRIWEVGRYTTALCMQDFFEDGIKRDRLLWAGDFRVQALSAYYAFGDYKLAKLDLLRFADIQMRDGAVPAVGPAPSSLILPDYCAYWVSSVWEHYLHSGDTEAVELLYPYVKRQMRWFAGHLNRHSLIPDAHRKEWWCFIDWADIEKKDEVSALQAVYYHALLSAANLAEVVGEPEDRVRYLAQARKVKKSFNERLWLEEYGAYADARTALGIGQRISQQSNSLAVLFGLADPKRWDSIHRKIFDESRVRPTTTPFMNFYVVKALYRMHRDRQALDLIRDYWGGMLRKGATTFWEVYDPRQPDDFVPDSSMSFCHGWSAGVTSILPAEVAGVKPLKPGFREVSVIPHLSDLEWVEARVPTPLGDVSVSWNKARNSGRLGGTIELPAGCPALIGIPIDPAGAIVVFDGVTIWNRGEASDGIPTGLSAVWADHRYVYIKTSRGGRYRVTAVSTAESDSAERLT